MAIAQVQHDARVIGNLAGDTFHATGSPRVHRLTSGSSPRTPRPRMTGKARSGAGSIRRRRRSPLPRTRCCTWRFTCSHLCIAIKIQNLEKKQKKSLEILRKQRNNNQVSHDLKKLEEATKTKENLMPYLLDCARSYCTVEEISNVLRGSFGEYHDPGIF